jgi:glycosyltransferase involved in cell wall biosynthesis
MKILHVVPGIEKIAGGTGRVAISMCSALARLGIDVNLVTTQDPLRQYELVDLQNLENVTFFFDRWKREYFAFSLSLKKWLHKNIKQYDLIHIHGVFNYPSYLAAIYAIRSKIPYIITSHGMLEKWALSNKAWTKYVAYRLLVKHQLERASAIHAISTSEQEELRNLKINNNIFCIYNGVNLTKFEECTSTDLFYQSFKSIDKNKTIILFLSRIDRKKGLDLLADAFREVYKNFPNTHLVIAGDTTPDNQSFMKIAQNYFADLIALGAVTFTGFLSGEMKYTALAAASLYILPSYSEGFSVSVLEAMAAGLPCVITTGCNFSEALDYSAASIVEPNANLIAKELMYFLEFPQQAKVMGYRAKRLVFKRYNWQLLTEKLLSIYQSILN